LPKSTTRNPISSDVHARAAQGSAAANTNRTLQIQTLFIKATPLYRARQKHEYSTQVPTFMCVRLEAAQQQTQTEQYTILRLTLSTALNTVFGKSTNTLQVPTFMCVRL